MTRSEGELFFCLIIDNPGLEFNSLVRFQVQRSTAHLRGRLSENNDLGPKYRPVPHTKLCMISVDLKYSHMDYFFWT